MPEFPKRNLTGGELDPALHSRADLTKYQTGLKTLRNFYIRPQGGVSNRAGTRFIEEVKDSAKTVRLIPFQFSKIQAYVLEFGDQYMRVVRNDGIVLETAVTITGASQTDPVVVTAPSHGFSNGDEVFITGVTGMTELNQNRYLVSNQTATTFEINTDGTGFGAYVSGGTVARLFTLTTPYLESELPLLKFTQSADVMTIVHPSHEPRNLSRTDHDAWSLDIIDYSPAIAAPTGVTATAGGGGGGSNTKDYEYVVTAVNGAGEESLASSPASENTNSLDGTHYNQVAWSAVTGTEYYNIYKAESEVSDIYGWIGESKTLSFRDYNLLPDIADTPAEDRTPFDSTDNYPSTVTYYQQRQVFGRTNTNTQTVFASQSGNFNSLRISRPTKADDAIERTIASQTVNEIRHFVDLNKLIVLTSGGEWLMTEGNDDVLTPASAGFRRQTAYGSEDVPPVVIGDTALFVQLGGRRIRDLAYSFQSDTYSGNDVTLLAEHLFKDSTIKELAYAQEPDGIVWAVMNDGSLRGLTYKKEHQIWGWHQHDTSGEFESVTVIPEGPVDSVYFVVKRTVGGVTKRYIEKLDARDYSDVADSVFLDSALTYDGTAATTISGLGHLEGLSVAALADGVVEAGLTVTDGAVTLSEAASKATIGLPYVCDVETLRIDPESGLGRGRSVIGNKLNVSQVVIGVVDSRGGLSGDSQNDLVEFKSRRLEDDYDAIALRTEDIRVYHGGNWDDNGHVFIRQNDPLPMNIIHITPEFDIG